MPKGGQEDAHSSTYSVIIVAAGEGSRMQSKTPKQFLLLSGKPVLMHTIKAFHSFSPSTQIIVVLSSDYTEEWGQLCKTYNFDTPHEITEGGKTRSDSVKSGLSLVVNEYVGVHDGARPLVSKEMLERGFKHAKAYNTAIPVIPIWDSIRHYTSSTEHESVDRSEYRIVQTPQIFKTKALRSAYQTELIGNFTDDATLYEAAGKGNLSFYEGEQSNLKITRPEDLTYASFIIDQQ